MSRAGLERTRPRHALAASASALLLVALIGVATLGADRGQAADDLLPRTGVSPEWERLLSAAFIATPDYGTRSSTVVLVGRDRRAVFVERSFGRGGAPGEEVSHELEITGP